MFDKLPADVRAAVEERQSNNGYGDIDGLHDYIKSLWADYEGCRSTTGVISQKLKESTLEARKRALMSKIMIEVLGENLQDIGLANTVMMDTAIQDLLPKLRLTPEETEFLTLKEKVGLFELMSKAGNRNARNYPALKQERQQDMAKSQQTTPTSDEYKRRLEAKFAAILAVRLEQKEDDT